MDSLKRISINCPQQTSTPGPEDPDCVPDVGDVIEELLVLQRDDVENLKQHSDQRPLHSHWEQR